MTPHTMDIVLDATRLPTRSRSPRMPTARVWCSAGRSLSLEENHDLRGAHGPRTRHREAADDPPALGRIAVERVLEVLWTELAGPPSVFLRQHLVFHGLSTSSKRRANRGLYGNPTRLWANLMWMATPSFDASTESAERDAPADRPVEDEIDDDDRHGRHREAGEQRARIADPLALERQQPDGDGVRIGGLQQHQADLGFPPYPDQIEQ